MAALTRHLWDFHGDAVRRAKLRERQLIWLGQGLPEGAQGKVAGVLAARAAARTTRARAAATA